MILRIISGLVVGPVFLGVIFFLPAGVLAALLAAMCAGISYELLRATRVAHSNGMYAYTAVSAALIPLGYYLGYGSWTLRFCALALMAALFFIAVSLYGTERQVGFEKVMVCLFAGLMIPVFLASLLILKQMEGGRYLVLLPVLCAFFTDVGAYFFGMLLGKHRGITKVSPNKSLEGYIGGVFTGALILTLYGVILQTFLSLEVSLPLMAIYGLVGSCITELGDLSFSLVKRQHDVKDYGNLIPGHGGLLDRFDSMIFAAPTLLLLVEVIPAF